MSAGSILMHAGSAAFQAPGGGEVQLVETARALEEQGHGVRPFIPWTDRLEDARVLHLFGMSPEGLALARAARCKHVPVVLSPICWFEPTAPLGNRWRAWAAYVTRRVFSALPHWRRQLLMLADAILPNSEREAEQLARCFAIDRRRFRVIPNGVDPRFAEGEPSAFREHVGLDEFVLYVGRIEPRKNVLGLIEATRGTRLPLVVVGDPVPGCEEYERECRRRGAGFLHRVHKIGHRDPMLASAYKAARVFALPSWFETPGLAALEAALAGAPVVITPLGSTRECFQDLVHYAHPARIGQIRAAIKSAWTAGGRVDLANRVKTRYLWSHVARMTAEVYDDLAP
jgi:glycosyltransferase involved in cell wall biosynthesis